MTQFLGGYKMAKLNPTLFSTHEIKVLGARLFDTLDFPGGDLVIYPENWWIRRGYITSDGSMINHFPEDESEEYCVRPILVISIDNTDFSIGDTFIFSGNKFKIMSNSTAFCTTDIGKCCRKLVNDKLNKWIELSLSKYTETKIISNIVNKPEEIKTEDIKAKKENEYTQNMLKEYNELSARIDELYRFYTMQLNNRQPHLKQFDTPNIKYPISVLTKQYAAMKEYQLYLQLRLIIEGINPEDYAPGEEFDF